MSMLAASNPAETEVIGVLATNELESGSVMARWEQFEIWQMKNDKWELLGAFPDLDLAQTMARSRTTKSRLVRAVYEDDKLIEQDVIADLGATRDVA